MKTLVLRDNEVIEYLADEFLSYAERQACGCAVLGIEEAVDKLLGAILEKLADSRISLSGIKIFELCAFADRSRSEFDRFIEILCKKTDFNPQNAVRLTGETCDKYLSLISDCGGIDYLFLELGENGIIGYNEAGAAFSGTAHLQKLSPKTIAVLAKSYSNVPATAYTMGIGDIMSAKHVSVAAIGESKAEALFKMLYARTDSVVPAAFLQLHTDVVVLADKSAAEKI